MICETSAQTTYSLAIERERFGEEAKDCFLCVQAYALDLHKSLNKHKHAFYFRNVKQWSTCLRVSSSTLLGR